MDVHCRDANLWKSEIWRCLILDRVPPSPNPSQNPLLQPTPLNLLIDQYLGLRPSLPHKLKVTKIDTHNQNQVKFHKNVQQSMKSKPNIF